jgi:hypothetical protein
MKALASQWIELTLVVLVLYLVLSRASGFSSVMGSIGKAYGGAVRSLQGR